MKDKEKGKIAKQLWKAKDWKILSIEEQKKKEEEEKEKPKE